MQRSLLRFASGARALSQSLASALLIAILIASAACAITVPLWLLSTRAPGIYGMVMLVLLALALIGLAYSGVRRRVAQTTSPTTWRIVLYRATVRILGIVALLALGYIAVLLLFGGRILIGIAAASLFFGLLVLYRTGSRRA